MSVGAPSAWSLSGTPACNLTSGAEALGHAVRALRRGDNAKALRSLKFAAELGDPLAQWKLGQMYANGDGLPRDDLLAFGYYSRIVNHHARDLPDGPCARIVSSALTALGRYYLKGIQNTTIHRDPARAHEAFNYAAAYFADADAQYELARLYLDGSGAPPDPQRAVRWLSLAARKGHYQAQAMLGAMLFNGEHVRRKPSLGLMWLSLARDAATGPDEPQVVKLYDMAVKRATDDERAAALAYLKQWMKQRH
jgi:TPR repeat protein